MDPVKARSVSRMKAYGLLNSIKFILHLHFMTVIVNAGDTTKVSASALGMSLSPRFLNGFFNDVDNNISENLGGGLGAACTKDKDCTTESSVCHKETCQCQQHYLHARPNQCLPGILLGFKCLFNAQCSMKVANSACVQGYCRCGASFAPYRRNNCLPGAGFGELCHSHQQCRLSTPNSYCKFSVPRVRGTCKCLTQLSHDGTKCGPKTYKLGSPCKRSGECSSDIPGAICVEVEGTKRISSIPEHLQHSFVHPTTKNDKKGAIDPFEGLHCACPKGYVEDTQGTRCISKMGRDVGLTPSSLGKRCDVSSQCQAADPHSICSSGVCNCVKPSSHCSNTNTGCHRDTFQCHSSGLCISWFYVCDGSPQCSDGSDETDCFSGRCPPHAFTCADGTCISRGWLCDGTPQCPDSSDERRCDNQDVCPASTFRCSDGRCLPGFVFCNATPTCSDSSDEPQDACIQGSITAAFCPYRCRNGRCRSTAIICSGKDGCGDNSDEENCSVCSCPRP